jgi:hypothetical protein
MPQSPQAWLQEKEIGYRSSDLLMIGEKKKD